MTSALSQQVPDASSVSVASHLHHFFQKQSKSALFISGSIVVHFGLLLFAAESPAIAPDTVEPPSELVVDFTPEEPEKEELMPLGKLDDALPLEAPVAPAKERTTPLVQQAPPQKAKPQTAQAEVTPEILGSDAEATAEPTANSFNPYAQHNTDHFTRGTAGVASEKSPVVENFGVETGSREASAASAAALKSWYGSIRAQLAAGGLSSYPKRARKLGLTGDVKLAVRIGANGQMLSVSIRKSSGAPILDQAALSGVQRVKNLPKPPAGAGATELIVPIKFSLR